MLISGIPASGDSMNYYLWVELKAFVGAIFMWDAVFTMRQYFDWGHIMVGFIRHEYGPTALIFLWLGVMFLLSASVGGLGFMSEKFRMKAVVQ